MLLLWTLWKIMFILKIILIFSKKLIYDLALLELKLPE